MISNIFKVKSKPLHRYNVEKAKFNYVNKAKHYSPLIKEWFSSIYAFNKNIVKFLPTLDKNLTVLISSYFNLYNTKLENKADSKNLRIRMKKSSVNKLLIGKPNIKHTSDKVDITVYTYNRRKIFYLNKMSNSDNKEFGFLGSNIKNLFVPFMENLKNDIIVLETKVNERSGTLLKEIVSDAAVKKHISLSNLINKTYITNYVKKHIRKEIILVRYKQSIKFEESKQEKQYLFPLISLVKRIYNKEISFNIVNLKYIYNSSNIFSTVLISKLNNRKNKLLEVLAASLGVCELWPTNKSSVYSNIYKERVLVQRLAVQDFISNKYYNLNKTTSHSLDKNDKLDELLLKTHINDINLITPDMIMNNVIESLRHKHITGVRVEVAGRVTKNSKAQRSMFKFNYKGSLKNTDSSHKGLPVVLLRGYAKSNLMYTQCNSKFRVGAYGLKTWISSI